MNNSEDTILRRSGMPYLVPVGRWHHHLLERVAPIMTYLILQALMVMAGFASLGYFHEFGEDAFMLVLIVMATLAVVVPLAITLYVFRRLSHRASHYVSGVALVLASVIGVMAVMTAVEVTLTEAIIAQATLTGAVLLLEWSGICSILAWAAKTAVREFHKIGTVAARLIPITLLIVVFSFYSAEAWQITDRLTVKSIVLLAICMSIFAVVMSIGVARSEFRQEFGSRTTIVGRAAMAVRKLNIYSVVVMTQLIQGAIFFCLFSLLLVIIGQVTLSEPTVASWLTHGSMYHQIMGTKLSWPISANMLRTACFISAFATLSFMISAATDKQYRGLLFDPIFKGVKRALRSVEK